LAGGCAEGEHGAGGKQKLAAALHGALLGLVTNVTGP